LPTAVGMGGTNSWAIINGPSRLYYQGTIVAYGSFVGSSGSVVMIAYDPTNGNLWFGENGSWFASGNPATGASPSLTGVTGTAIVAAAGSGSGSNTFDYNFGQQPFTYNAPTGFVALNTYNLPTSTIVNGSKEMGILLYTGDGTTSKDVTGLSFQPDLTYVKNRSAASDPTFSDTLRGITKVLYTDATSAESTAPSFGYINSILSTGFNVNSGGGVEANFNKNGQNYVGWTWKAGQGTNTSNTNGSITSTVSVNASAGFSVVTWTANASANQSIGHGLGVAPSLVIVKDRTTVINWNVWFTGFTANEYLLLNSTAAKASFSSVWYQVPDSSKFYVGSTATAVNYQNGDAYVAYCWTPIAGFSAFGSYTGNGSTDGPFVYLGFRPKFVMIKRYDVGAPWVIFDSSRNTYNVVNNYLQAQDSAAEGSGSSPNDIDDFLSNGFKVRCSNAGQNASGGGYIYMAFAENPFRNALAR